MAHKYDLISNFQNQNESKSEKTRAELILATICRKSFSEGNIKLFSKTGSIDKDRPPTGKNNIFDQDLFEKRSEICNEKW